MDKWDENWTEEVKRIAIKQSYFVHKHKGTIGAVKRVVEPIGYLIELKEWFQTNPQGTPGTFSLTVEVSESGLNEQTYNELVRLINDVNPSQDISISSLSPSPQQGHLVPLLVSNGAKSSRYIHNRNIYGITIFCNLNRLRNTGFCSGIKPRAAITTYSICCGRWQWTSCYTNSKCHSTCASNAHRACKCSFSGPSQ